MTDSLNIDRIAAELNGRSALHAIGQLQSIRKTLKGFERLPSRTIFTGQTIHEGWAFHHGGRTELQFNIGRENPDGAEEMRHGVAFSFELSQTLPDINILVPKVRLFNEYLQCTRSNSRTCGCGTMLKRCEAAITQPVRFCLNL